MMRGTGCQWKLESRVSSGQRRNVHHWHATVEGFAGFQPSSASHAWREVMPLVAKHGDLREAMA
jgi:hypothetical protein